MSPPEIRELLDQALRLHSALRLIEAEAIYRRILALEPRNADALHLLGMIHLFRGDAPAARELIAAAIDINPDAPAFQSNLALALKSMGQREQAAGVLDRLLSAHPDFPAAHWVRATLRNETGDASGCYEACAQLVQLDPANVAAHVLMSATALALSRPADARLAAERAVALDPNNGGARWNLAFALLLMGDFERGWREYEWRSKRPGYNYLHRDFRQPMWDGAPLESKHILLHAEGGLGDAIMFSRYVPLVAQRAAKVTLECQPALRDLFLSIPGVSEVIARGQPLPSFDFHCPLQGFPLRFGTTRDNIPATVPYLHADPGRVHHFRDRLVAAVPSPRFRIGVAWHGSPSERDPRSRTLDVFDLLADIPGVAFISLQKDADRDATARTAIGRGMVDLTDDLHHFADTAALVGNLDLVISVDTSVAHLAGALAKRTFVLIPRNPDFRWMLDREDSPWYPTMRLFRQREPLEWTEPVSAMRAAIVKLAAAPDK